MLDGADGRSPDFVQSLERGLAVIRAFGAERPQLTLSEVAKATGLTRAAARRFLLTLVQLGYARSEGRYFSLRPRVLELGYAYLSALGLSEVAQPHLEELGARVHESASISVLDGMDIVYVVRAPSRRIMSVSIALGTRFPAYAASMGRVLLAGLGQRELDDYLAEVQFQPLTPNTIVDEIRLREVLDEIRQQGYATVDQELELGLRSVAVPIRDGRGAVIAAMNVSAHVTSVTVEAMLTDILPQLQTTAREIESDLQTPRYRATSAR
ncbi:MAG: IclR family transcriptional regulator [Candidatus Dormiibacterota bacterium]